jgi:hypothetical protein
VSPGYPGIGREWVGKLLCPAGVVHAVVTIFWPAVVRYH